MKIELPNSWHEIEISKFPLIYDIIRDTEIDPIDREIRVISILTDIAVSEIEKIRIDQLKELIKSVNFIFKMEFPKPTELFKHNGYRWIVNYDITKLNAGEFISLAKLTESEESIISNLPQLVAMFIKPYKIKWFKLVPIDMQQDEIVKHVSTMNIGIVYPLCVFFCNVIKNLLPDIEDYLANQMEIAKTIVNENLPNNKNIQNIGVGM